MSVEKSVDKIIKSYNSGKSMRAIGDKYNLSSWKIRKLLVKNGVAIGSNARYKKYKIDETVFDKNKLNAKACYFLGFLMADCCIDGDKAIRINLSPKDKIILQKINRFLKSNNPIRYKRRWDKRRKKFYDSVLLVITSVKLVNVLKVYGIVKAKGGKEFIPQNIPKKYIRDFIRGYFDGDGFVGTYLNPHTRTYSLDIVSENDIILNELAEYFYQYDIVLKVKKIKEKEWRLRCTNPKTILQVYSILYKDESCECLARKKNTFKYIQKIYNKREGLS